MVKVLKGLFSHYQRREIDSINSLSRLL